jgi:O-antigen/teichoic acid export membrane protein
LIINLNKKGIFCAGSEATWVFIGQAGVAIGGLLSVKLFTHLLSPSEYGRFSIANTVMLLIINSYIEPL